MQLGFFTGVTPLGHQQAPGEVKKHGRGPGVLEVLEVQVYVLPDDPGIFGD